MKKFTYEMLSQWSLYSLQEKVAEYGVENAHEWDREDCIDFLLRK